MQKNKKGFSLIESLMAMVVLSIGLLAVVTLFTKSATQAVDTEKNITALGLAQEGVELVRVVRNDDVVAGAPTGIFESLDGITGALSNGGSKDTCKVSPAFISGVLTAGMDCLGGNYKLGVYPTRDWYYHSSSETADSAYPVFWRRIYVQRVNDDRRDIASVVFYKDPGSNWPSSITDVDKTHCSLQKGCVFVKAVLQ